MQWALASILHVSKGRGSPAPYPSYAFMHLLAQEEAIEIFIWLNIKIPFH